MSAVSEKKDRSFSIWRVFKLLIFLGVITLAILALFYLGYFDRLAKWQGVDRRAEESPLPVVRIMSAEPESQEIELVLPSFLVSYHVTPILARTNGYLKNFYVDIGDEVKAGQLLCEIEVPDVDAELPPAKSNVKSLMAKMEIAKLTAERWTTLYQQDPDAVSKEEVDQTVAVYQSSVADFEAAKGNVKRLKVLQSFKDVYAPFDGIIVERNIDIGSLISAGNETLTQPYITGFEVLTQPLFKIASMDVLRAFVEVPQPYYPYINVGERAQVYVAEYPDKVFSGVIDRDAHALDQVSRTLLTQVNIENKEGVLRPGLYAQVKFSFKPFDNSFKVPIGALIIRQGPPFVALLKEDHTVFLQQVRIGRDFGNSVQIIKGLKKGDKIILNPNFKIKDGIKVKVKE